MSDRKEFEDWFFSPSNSMSMSDMDVAWEAWQVSAILALQKNNFSHERVPMTEEQAEELAYQAFKDHMEDRNDDMEIDLVRKVERFHSIGITAQAKKEQE